MTSTGRGAGFDFSVISDHYQPWLACAGALAVRVAVLGAAAQATERIGLMTYVTCPRALPPGGRRPEGGDACRSCRAAASASVSAPARTSTSTSSARAGRRGRPPRDARGGVEIISACSTGATASDTRGRHFDVESARLWDLPDGTRVPIGVAVSGPDSCRLAGSRADLMIAIGAQRRTSARCSTRRRAPGSRGWADRRSLRPESRDAAVARAARAVPLVRPRLEGQRRPPESRRVRVGHGLCEPRARRGADRVRTRRPRARRQHHAVHPGRVHGDRAGADRRGHPGEVHRVG